VRLQGDAPQLHLLFGAPGQTAGILSLPGGAAGCMCAGDAEQRLGAAFFRDHRLEHCRSHRRREAPPA
ncbi:hypothetical protein ATANTOWER_007284, partial [Ataeniobius toweri]|nr:hypothetical protein [Ataeniobius toweri]